MISLKSYKQALSSHGQSIGNIRKTQSNIIMNETFTHDSTYKQVYILTKDGWKFEDAKYQFHSAQSISKDQADYYLQFRTGVHFPVGSYVIIPDDTTDGIGLDLEELKNPFLQPIDKRINWWIIVGRDNANAYVRYMILKCDWDFKWVYKGKVMSCWACSRSASSYTSGVWKDYVNTQSAAFGNNVVYSFVYAGTSLEP